MRFILKLALIPSLKIYTTTLIATFISSFKAHFFLPYFHRHISNHFPWLSLIPQRQMCLYVYLVWEFAVKTAQQGKQRQKQTKTQKFSFLNEQNWTLQSLPSHSLSIVILKHPHCKFGEHTMNIYLYLRMQNEGKWIYFTFSHPKANKNFFLFSTEHQFLGHLELCQKKN